MILFCMHFFGSHQRKSLLQIEPHLISKRADGAGAGTVMFLDPFIENMLKQIEILLHGRNLLESHEL